MRIEGTWRNDLHRFTVLIPCAGSVGETILMDAIQRELRRYISEHLNFNFREMLDAALTATRVPMTDAEKKQFFDKHIRPFQASMDAEGNLQITLKM